MRQRMDMHMYIRIVIPLRSLLNLVPYDTACKPVCQPSNCKKYTPA